MKLSEYLKVARKKKGMTQQQLADKLKVSVNTIQNYENDRREPSYEMLCNISNILDLSIIDILPSKINNEIDKYIHDINLQKLVANQTKRMLNDADKGNTYTNVDDFIIQNNISILFENNPQKTFKLFLKALDLPYDMEDISEETINTIYQKVKHYIEIEFTILFNEGTLYK